MSRLAYILDKTHLIANDHVCLSALSKYIVRQPLNSIHAISFSPC